MADDADVFMQGISNLGTLVGLGSSLKDIFGSSPPTAADIAAAVAQEVEKVFFGQSADSQIITASGDLAAAQQFLAVDYQNAVDNGESTTDRWNLLDASSTAPGLSQLTAAASALEGWIGEAEQQDQDMVAAKAAPVYIGIYLVICLLHRERAAVAPDAPTKAAELQDMRDKARIAISTMMPHVVSLCTKRIGALSYSEYVKSDIVIGGRRTYEYNVAQITDSWFSGASDAVAAWQSVDEDNDFSKVAHRIWNAYYRVLFSGNDADCNEFRSSLNNARLDGLSMLKGWRDDFVSQSYPSVCAFGKWAENVRSLLAQLDVVASAVAGLQQDEWAWCSRCSGLYYSGTKSVCPATQGAHAHDAVSSNYVLHCNSPSPPSGMQDNWLWCNKCSGLHLNQGARPCPAGGTHDPAGSGNYVLAYGAVPDASNLGINSTQPNWLWCSKCAGLHYQWGNSVCPAGGAHDATGSANYWLANIGLIPQP
jgi:hypothetical protein